MTYYYPTQATGRKAQHERERLFSGLPHEEPGTPARKPTNKKEPPGTQRAQTTRYLNPMNNDGEVNGDAMESYDAEAQARLPSTILTGERCY